MYANNLFLHISLTLSVSTSMSIMCNFKKKIRCTFGWLIWSQVPLKHHRHVVVISNLLMADNFCNLAYILIQTRRGRERDWWRKIVKRSCTHLFQQKEGEKKEQRDVVSKTFVLNEKIFFKKFTGKYMAIIGPSGVLFMVWLLLVHWWRWCWRGWRGRARCLASLLKPLDHAVDIISHLLRRRQIFAFEHHDLVVMYLFLLASAFEKLVQCIVYDANNRHYITCQFLTKLLHLVSNNIPPQSEPLICWGVLLGINCAGFFNLSNGWIRLLDNSPSRKLLNLSVS